MKNHEFGIDFHDDKINVFKPFGVGMSSCPPKHMAEALLRVVLANIVWILMWSYVRSAKHSTRTRLYFSRMKRRDR